MSREQIQAEIRLRPTPLSSVTRISRTKIRHKLLVVDLIENIKAKFEMDGTFQLVVQQTGLTLNPSLSLEQQGIADKVVLDFVGTTQTIKSDLLKQIETILASAYPEGERKDIRLAGQIGFRLLGNDVRRFWDLRFQPAIIGRRFRNEPRNNILLAADLTELPQGQTVSRWHACVSSEDERFSLTALNRNNPSYLNDVKLEHNETKPLNIGDKVRARRVELAFVHRDSSNSFLG
jgi:hypothetical protein